MTPRPGTNFIPADRLGSTLIACERRSRKARLLEIDSRYADCIIQRYQEYTGNSAKLERDDRTFEEIAAERARRGFVTPIKKDL
jgi:DNA modification methylase